jgi:hypothetical protein
MWGRDLGTLVVLVNEWGCGRSNVVRRNEEEEEMIFGVWINGHTLWMSGTSME